MPCMYNGMPVKGNKGSCPMNSTWVEDTPQAPVDDRNLLEKAGGYLMNNKLQAASIGAMAIPFAGPFISGGLRGAGLLAKGASMGKGRIGNLMDKMFRKDVMRPKIVPQPKNFNGPPSPFMPAVLEKGRALSIPKVAGTTSALAGAGGFYASGADDRQLQQQQMQQQQATQANNALEQNTASLNAINAKQIEAERVAGLNPMERMMENLKNPGFLNESMSGAKGDTRLNRLGQLMSYYGSTPKQRAKMKDPMDRFAAIEKSVADNELALAKAQQTLSSPFGKPTVKNLADSLVNKVTSQFGDTWLTFGAEKEEIPAIANAVAIRITQLTQQFPGADPAQIEAEAFKQIEEEGWKNVA